MKKVIFSALALGMVLFACNKKQIEPEKDKKEEYRQELIEAYQKQKSIIDNNDYSKLKLVDNRTLEFESVEYYESFVKNAKDKQIDFFKKHLKEKMPNYKSIYSKQQERELDLFDDDFIQTILDVNQIVKIGEWYVRLNPETQKVYATSDKNSNAYELVLREDADNEKVYDFSFDESVLEYLNDPESLEDRKFWCGETGVGWVSEYEYFNSLDLNNPSLQVNSNKLTLKNHKWGIYFKIKVHCTSPNTGVPQRFWLHFTKRKYKHRCQSLHELGEGYVWSSEINSNTPDWKYTLDSGTRNYNKIWVRIELAGRVSVDYYGNFIYDQNIPYPVEIRVNM